MLLTIAIINDDANEYLHGLFTSMSNCLDFKGAVELIVVETHSSSEMRKDLPIPVKIKKEFCFGERVSRRGILYNKAVELASGHYILFVHSDVAFDPEFFKNLNNHLSGNKPVDFANINQLYPEGWSFGTNTLYVDFQQEQIQQKQLWTSPPDDLVFKPYLHCSESCFLVKRTSFIYFEFDTFFNDSLFEFSLINDIRMNGGEIAYFDDCKVVHFFIEEYEKVKNQQSDFKKWNFRKKYLYSLYQKDEEIKQRGQLLNNTQAELENVSYLLDEERKNIGELRGQVVTIELQIQEKDNVLAGFSQAAENALLESQQKDATLLQLRAELDGMNARVLEKDGVLSELSQSLEGSLRAVAEKDAALLQLRAELDGMNARVLEKDGVLSELSQSLEGSLRAVAEKDAALLQLRAELDGMNARMSHTNIELSQKYELIDQYINSWSWKLTRPLRWLVGRYINLTGLLKNRL